MLSGLQDLDLLLSEAQPNISQGDELSDLQLTGHNPVKTDDFRKALTTFNTWLTATETEFPKWLLHLEPNVVTIVKHESMAKISGVYETIYKAIIERDGYQVVLDDNNIDLKLPDNIKNMLCSND